MNRLHKIVHNIKKLPPFFQKTALSFTIGNVVKFVGTAGINFENMTTNQVILTLANKKKVQNHLQQIHAAATALLAETASGMVFGMNIPDNKIALVKNMSINYTKRSQGEQKAIAILTDEAIQIIKSEDKGEVLIPVTITDSVGTQVVEVEILWAWIPKK